MAPSAITADPVPITVNKAFPTKSTATRSLKSGTKPKPSGPDRVFTRDNVTYGDWRDDLVRDGYVVVKGAVPVERAEKYGDEMLTWLEHLCVQLPYLSSLSTRQRNM